MEAFFLEPKLTMVISHCQGRGSIACALRSGLLKTTRLRLRTQSDNTFQHSYSQTSLADPTKRILVHWMDADGSTGPKTSLAWNYRSETQTNHSVGDSTGESSPNYEDCSFKLSGPKRQRFFHCPLGVRRTVESLTVAVVTGMISFVHEHHRSHQLPRYDDACLVSQQVSGQADVGQDEAQIIVAPFCSQVKDNKEDMIARYTE